MKWKMWLIVVVAVAAVAAVTFFVVPLAIAVALGVPVCWENPDKFDSAAWRSADTNGACNVRTGMVDDLLASSELRAGRPRLEVESLLGPTEDVDYWLTEEEGLVYVTDCWIDCDWLVIEFDDQQRLVTAFTAQD